MTTITAPPRKASAPRLGKIGIAWIIGVFVLLFLSLGIGWFDDTTELTPVHEGMIEVSFWGAGMSAHRPPEDKAKDPDEIPSRGYFCARVTVQRAKAAIRVLHAGTHKLPPGTVVLCPSH